LLIVRRLIISRLFGLDFFEYFQLAEDIGAEPLPILNSGMACQFNTAEVVPMDQIDPYMQDALDLIEFASGDICLWCTEVLFVRQYQSE
jgi:alpha-L-arabinofuranosidase